MFLKLDQEAYREQESKEEEKRLLIPQLERKHQNSELQHENLYNLLAAKSYHMHAIKTIHMNTITTANKID